MTNNELEERVDRIISNMGCCIVFFVVLVLVAATQLQEAFHKLHQRIEVLEKQSPHSPEKAGEKK